jgi:hypothetical protein
MADTDPVEESAETQETQDARLAKLEAEQAEQGGKLDQILALIKGEGEVHEKAEQHTQERLDSSSTIADTIAKQMEAAVERVGAAQAQKAADEQHAKDHAALREQQEKQPREAGSGLAGKIRSSWRLPDER